jgi:hypothetical protein
VKKLRDICSGRVRLSGTSARRATPQRELSRGLRPWLGSTGCTCCHSPRWSWRSARSAFCFSRCKVASVGGLFAFFRSISFISRAIILTELARRPRAAAIARVLIPPRTNITRCCFSASDQSLGLAVRFFILGKPLQLAVPICATGSSRDLVGIRFKSFRQRGAEEPNGALEMTTATRKSSASSARISKA